MVSTVPGPAGPAGADGANGTNGSNAYTTTTAQYTQPAVGADVTVAVTDSTWASLTQVVYVSTGGYYTVQGKPDSTHLTLRNLGYTGNAAPAAIVATSQTVSPGGLQGPTGSAGAGSLNALSPTTTKGDIIVDNGANSPSASDVRLPVGTNGQLLASVSTQPTGLQWTTVVPNSTTDNGIPRFDGTAGTPVPLQTSKVVITDDGAIQASGSGGNARGANAVDLQTVRSGAAQVASGVESFIGGGDSNTASGTDSAVVGGDGNSATATNSFCGGGSDNSSNADGSALVGGISNIAGGQYSFIGGGSSNTTSSDYSCITGGLGGDTINYAEVSYAAGLFAAAGDAKSMQLMWRIATTDATANVEMRLDGSSERASIPVGTSWHFDIMLVGRSSAGVSASWTAKGLITNNAGTTAMTCAATIASICDGTGATWGVAGSFVVSADNANDALHLDVTGAIGTNIRWVAHGRIIQVKF